jgi:hypothetical protein
VLTEADIIWKVRLGMAPAFLILVEKISVTCGSFMTTMAAGRQVLLLLTEAGRCGRQACSLFYNRTHSRKVQQHEQWQQ